MSFSYLALHIHTFLPLTNGPTFPDLLQTVWIGLSKQNFHRLLQ